MSTKTEMNNKRVMNGFGTITGRSGRDVHHRLHKVPLLGIGKFLLAAALCLANPLAYGVDTDSDGVDDTQDADALNPMVDWVATPEKTYEWIAIPDAPAGYVAVDMNNHGQILFQRTDYGTEVDIWPNNLQTSPVAKVCDPTLSGPGRWKDILFKPAPFNLRVYGYQQAQVVLLSIPLPMFRPIPDVWGVTHDLGGVGVAALGDDGSVMANVNYRYTYYNGHPEDPKFSSSQHSTYVFKWSVSDYTTCYLHGDDRGYQNDTTSYSCNQVAGYQSLPGAGPTDPPVTKAVIFDEIKPINLGLTTNVSLVQAPMFGTGTMHTVQTGRSPYLDLSNYNLYPPYVEFTHRGRVMLWKSYVAPDYVYTVGLAGTTGFTTVTGVPWSIFEIPTGVGGAGRWGLTLNNVNHLITGSSAISMGIVGVLQLDSLGTGIGDRDSLRDIWRNGTWRTVGSMTTNASFIPGSLVLKKIGRTGVIWAGNGTEEGIFRPNP
jgi:hypothetical protein